MYSEALKAQIRKDYRAYEFGYKKLAAQYGLKRDTVRAIILATDGTRRMADEQDQDELKFDSPEEELKYYKTAAMYFKAYSRRLEINMAEDLKKKARLKQSSNAKKKEQK